MNITNGRTQEQFQLGITQIKTLHANQEFLVDNELSEKIKNWHKFYVQNSTEVQIIGLVDPDGPGAKRKAKKIITPEGGVTMLDFARQLLDPNLKEIYSRVLDQDAEEFAERELNRFKAEGKNAEEFIPTLIIPNGSYSFGDIMAKIEGYDILVLATKDGEQKIKLEEGATYSMNRKNLKDKKSPGITQTFTVVRIPKEETGGKLILKTEEEDLIQVSKDSSFTIKGPIRLEIPDKISKATALDLVELNDRINALGVIEKVEKATEGEAVAIDTDGLPKDPNALPGFIIANRNLFASHGQVVNAKNIAEKIERRFKNLEDTAALCFSSMCMTIADGMYKKIAGAGPMSYTELKTEIGEALGFFKKAADYYKKAGDATDANVNKDDLATNLYEHPLMDVRAIKVADTNNYAITRVSGTHIDPIEKKFSEKIEAEIAEINKDRKKTKFKREQAKSDGNILVYVLKGDKLNGISIEESTTAVSLKEIEELRKVASHEDEERIAREAQEAEKTRLAAEEEAERIETAQRDRLTEETSTVKTP